MLFWEIPTPLWLIVGIVVFSVAAGFLLGVAAAQPRRRR